MKTKKEKKVKKSILAKSMKANKSNRKKAKLIQLENEDYNNALQEVIEIDQESLQQTVVPPRVKKVRKIPTPKKKVPKRPTTTEDVEENYMIVPWSTISEWNTVCLDFHHGNYEQVIEIIEVWQKRVPSLPVGVEATLFLLEAVVYDSKNLLNQSQQSHSNSNDQLLLNTEDHARSLYSLAIIRYLNHVSHLAAQSLGESSIRPTRELAAMVDTPDWIVSLRNEISHGSTAPSIEILRMAGKFVLDWLKVKYWKLPEEQQESPLVDDPNDPLTMTGHVGEDEVPIQIDELLAVYVASRIYKLRHIYWIRDEDIVKHVTLNNTQVKTKTAGMSLRKKLKNYLQRHPSTFCTVLSQALLPTPEFYENFASILRKNQNKDDLDEELFIFEKFYAVWLPVMKMLQTKGILLTILNNLCEVITSLENEKMWVVCARWVDKILEIIESSGKRYTNALTTFLGTVVKYPNYSTPIFLERLFRLTEPRIGPVAVQKLTLLVSLMLEDKESTKKRRRLGTTKLFTLDDIESQNINKEGMEGVVTEISQSGLAYKKKWELDQRGEDFWSKLHMGAVF